MSKNREKVFDDPLAGGLFDSGSSSSSKGPELVAEVDTSVFRTIDSSKIRLKENKAKEKAAAATTATAATSSAPSKSSDPLFDDSCANSDTRGLGTNLDLWSAPAAKPNDSIDILSNYTISNDSDLFGSSSQFTKEEPKKTYSSVPASSTNTTLRTSKVEVDEMSFDKLGVGRILEREEDLDFDTFGKTRVVMGEKPTPKALNINNDLLDISALDNLKSLESVTSQSSKPSSSQKSSQLFSTDTPTTTDIDLANLDLNSYIQSQESSSGGGLFD